MENYNIPLGIDPKSFLTGLDSIEAGLNKITSDAKVASSAISESMNNSGRSSDALVSKINAGANAAKNFKDAATQAGVSIENAFSADRVNTTEITNKVNVFVAKMKDVIGKPIDFKFNLNQAAIDLLNTKMKEAKNQMEGFQIVIDSAVNRLSGLAKGSTEFNKLSKQIAEATGFLDVLKMDMVEMAAIPSVANPVVELGNEAEKATPKTASLKSQIRQLKEELAQMELAGKAGTAEFVELSKRAGALADQFQDTSSRVKTLASDTKGLDAGISAVRGLAGAFAITQGALAAFGEQNEEAARAIQKVQGAMAILQGIQEVANVLNKDSALSVYLQTYASSTHTAAVATETTAINAQTISTEAAIVATNAWTVALLANPITAIVAVLAVAIAALYEFSQAQKQGGLSAEQFNKALEQQAILLQQDYDRVDRRAKVSEARAESERKNQSDILQIQLGALKQKQIYDQIEIDEVIRKNAQLDHKDKDYAKSYEAGIKKIEDLQQQRSNRSAEITADEINLQKQQQDESLKLQADLLKERQANYDAQIAIQIAAKNYAFEILNSRIADLKDGEQKELTVLRSGLNQKLQGIDQEGKANLKKLTDTRANLAIELQLADENGKKLIVAQQQDNERQIAAELHNASIRTELKQTLTTSELAAEKKIREKYANERADFEFDTQNVLLNIQKDSEAKKIAILNLAAQHEKEVLERSNLNAVDLNNRRDAIDLKLNHDIAAAKLDSGLQQLALDKTTNENLINEAKNHAVSNNQTQSYYNILLLKNEQDNARQQLDLLIKSGKVLTDQEVINAKARVDGADGALKQAVNNKPPQTLIGLLFPNEDQKTQDFIQKSLTSALSDAGKAIDDYASMVVDRYQKIVDAKKAAVQADDDALNTLQSQLDKEIAARDKGYANNIAGIKAEIDAKNKARTDDVKSQEEAQKRLEKSQKAQANAQAALQAANLITAATNIYLASSDLGAVGVIIGGVAIAAMLAAFIASKAKANEAISASSSATKFAKGGEVGGKSHADGGQKYYSPDSSVGVIELEGGEYVTRKSQTEKFKPLLEGINNNSLKGISDVDIRDMLAGLGVHMDIESEHAGALKEARFFTSHTIDRETGRHAETPQELKSIDKNVQTMMDRQNEQTHHYEDANFHYTVKGNKTIRVPKK